MFCTALTLQEDRQFLGAANIWDKETAILYATYTQPFNNFIYAYMTFHTKKC